MEIRVLKYFLAVAKEQSISRAAEVLHMTQPPLSRQIADLEGELGKKLFIRGGRYLTLTEEGRYLKKQAEEILALSERTAKAIRAIDNEIIGDVRIAAGETTRFQYIGKAAKQLQQIHPGITFSLFSGNYEDVVDKLDSGLADFGLLIGTSGVEKYNYIRLPDKDRWGLLIRRDHPYAQKDCICAEDIRELSLIMSRQALETNEFVGWLKGSVEQLRVVSTYNLLFNAAEMAKAVSGSVLCLDGLHASYDGNELTFIPLYPTLETAVCLVWSKRHTLSKPAAAFLDVFREVLR